MNGVKVTVTRENGVFYCNIDGNRMYPFKHDEKLYEFLNKEIPSDMIELNTFSINDEHDWYGGHNRVTLFTLKNSDNTQKFLELDNSHEVGY